MVAFKVKSCLAPPLTQSQGSPARSHHGYLMEEPFDTLPPDSHAGLLRRVPLVKAHTYR